VGEAGGRHRRTDSFQGSSVVEEEEEKEQKDSLYTFPQADIDPCQLPPSTAPAHLQLYPVLIRSDSKL
jgi:hypothetical protein